MSQSILFGGLNGPWARFLEWQHRPEVHVCGVRFIFFRMLDVTSPVNGCAQRSPQVAQHTNPRGQAMRPPKIIGAKLWQADLQDSTARTIELVFSGSCAIISRMPQGELTTSLTRGGTRKARLLEPCFARTRPLILSHCAAKFCIQAMVQRLSPC